MKISELIEELKKFDQSLEVYVAGYEGGYDDLSRVEPIRLCRDFYTEEWYYGNHEEYDVVRKGPVNPSDYIQSKGIVLTK